jgi:hypothetical protein
MQKTIIIGDVHGCIDELLELMKQFAPSADDHIIFIGDLIDRGPDSLSVLRQVVQWSKLFHVRLVLGNHEEKFLRFIQHINDASGREKGMTGIDKFHDLYINLNDEELRFLKDAYYCLHLPDLNALILHAGVLPNSPITLPASYRYNTDFAAHQKKTLSLLNKTRFISSSGKFIAREPFVQLGAKQFTHATGIDNGCVFGGWLTAVEISTDGVRYISIPANKNYAINT